MGAGQPDRARRTWATIPRRFPLDERAPLALLLAGQLSAQLGDVASARQWLDRLVGRYPASAAASVGRLSRSILAVQLGNEQEAVGDLRSLMEHGQLCAAHERHIVLDGLAGGALKAPVVRVNGHGCSLAPPGLHPLEQFAAPFLDGAGDPETTPVVLHALVRLGVEDRQWTDVAALSGDLVTGYPAYGPLASLLTRVASEAAADRQWPIVRSIYERLTARLPGTPLSPRACLDFAESLMRTGAPSLALVQLQQFVLVDQSHEQAPRRLLLRGEISEALGRPQDALAAYDRLGREYPSAEWTAESQLPRARALEAAGQRKQARALLQQILDGAEGDVFGEAAFRLAESLATDGQRALAMQWYLTAAYVDADSPWGQRAQLGALHGLLASGDQAAADAVYRRMLASGKTDPALLDEARRAIEAPDRGRQRPGIRQE